MIFTTISKIPASKKVFNENPYFFTDSFPVEGKNYYRVKIEELNEAIIYSEIKEIWMDKNETEIEIFPNPLPSNSSEIHIKNQHLPSGNYEFILMDITGKIILEKELTFNNGMNIILKINKRLLHGMYFIKIRDKNNTRAKSLIVQ